MLLSLYAAASASSGPALAGDAEVVDIGSRREMFVDRFLVDRMEGTRLKLHTPRDAGKAFALDKPWEGFGGYPTVIYNGEKYQMFYRGKTGMTNAGNPDETTCYAESVDGIHWTKPNLGLFEVHGTRENNVILDNSFAPVCSNFGPFIDTRPGVPADQRYKALGGTFPISWRKEPDSDGVLALVSPDGIRWEYLQEEPVIPSSLHPAKNCDTAQPSALSVKRKGDGSSCFGVCALAGAGRGLGIVHLELDSHGHEPLRGEKLAFLKWVAGANDCRRQGVGTKLLQWGVEVARAESCLWIYGCVDCDNTIATALLKKCGFALLPVTEREGRRECVAVKPLRGYGCNV